MQKCLTSNKFYFFMFYLQRHFLIINFGDLIAVKYVFHILKKTRLKQKGKENKEKGRRYGQETGRKEEERQKPAGRNGKEG